MALELNMLFRVHVGIAEEDKKNPLSMKPKAVY